jgi:short-subunit dehydrogenase
MAKFNLTGRRALITGASSGIGRALAIELAKHDVDVVLFARRAERLAHVADEVKKIGRRAVCVAGDVTDVQARQRALAAAHDQLGGLDILVNNAGIAAHGRFAEADPGRLRPIFEVNTLAPIEFIRAALPLLREGHDPLVVNIGSILGDRGVPFKSEYCASKFALHGFSESIRPEFAKLGIGVLLVAPGPTESEHFNKLLEDKGLPWPEPKRQSPEKVARRIVKEMENDRDEIVVGFPSRLWLLLNRVFPRLVDRILNRYG